MSSSPSSKSSSFSPSDIPNESVASIPEPKLATSALNDLQTEEQRKLLDTVARVRKCGLEGTVSLPQIVVCGDQSAGKSSVLEALTGIPFPRNDNLCTRYATEIHLRLANVDKITIRIIPDPERPSLEQTDIKSFEESITEFTELPTIMDAAMEKMGITKKDDADDSQKKSAFSRDVLSIEIEGPGRNQLTLVDIPGLIGAETKQTTKADIALVADITKHYIEQPRTICLAVVCAATDYANQSILDRVREVDPNGARTLGVITKPDIPPTGSGLETAYIELAKNSDIFFQLGWHVVKNRKFEESKVSLEKRNSIEELFFKTTNWKCLPKDCVGIDSLKRRLSILLYEHVKKELPNLREELDSALQEANDQVLQLGIRRSTGQDCKAYLTQLSVDFQEVCKAALDGHYEGAYFHNKVDPDFLPNSRSTICRTRAVIQMLNTKFEKDLRTCGHKYEINWASNNDGSPLISGPCKPIGPKRLTKKEALDWAQKALMRNRGKELIGNFNPLLIGELFWEQSEKWEKIAAAHIDKVEDICRHFLKYLLQDKCPEDVEKRIWNMKIRTDLKARHQAAVKELHLLIQDHKNYPINYNHYYTDTISERRYERQKAALEKSIDDASTTETTHPRFNETAVTTEIDAKQVLESYLQRINPNMITFTCEEALDSVFAIYKVCQKVFVANVTMQVIERHIVRDLEKIFTPIFVNSLTSAQAEALASEPLSVQRQRAYLVDQIEKLEQGQEIFRSVM